MPVEEKMPPSPKQKFIILGAGINGLSCAYRIRQTYPDADLEIWSDRFSPDTTSDVAAGLWEPFLLGDTPTELVGKWSRESYHYFHDLWRAGLADKCGISLIPYVAVTAKVDGLEDPIWKDFAFGYGELSAQRLEELGREHSVKYVSGNEFVTFTCEPSRLLQFYTLALKSSPGVTFRQRKITNLREVLALDQPTSTVVINCLGLGSREVLGDDEGTLVATRGQIRRVDAPWMYQVLISDSGYVIPNTGSVTLGGTKQKGDVDLLVRKEDRDGINRGCCGMVPGLGKAPVLGDFVGLRPTRSSVRLEIEWIDGVAVVHNYGHGGGGITLAWGCAGHVLSLVQELMPLINSSPRAKL